MKNVKTVLGWALGLLSATLGSYASVQARNNGYYRPKTASNSMFSSFVRL